MMRLLLAILLAAPVAAGDAGAVAAAFAAADRAAAAADAVPTPTATAAPTPAPAPTATPTATPTPTADTDTDAAARLGAALARLERLAGDFTQRTTDADGHEDEPSSGSFMLQRPAFLRWQVAMPWPSLLIGDGRQILFYDEGLAQMTVRDWDANPHSNPALVLLGGAQLGRHFAVRLVRGVWHLRPLDDGGWVTEIRLRLDGRGLPQLLQLHDSLGQVQSIQFTNVRRPANALDGSHFRFAPPPGTAVSRERSVDSAAPVP